MSVQLDDIVQKGRFMSYMTESGKRSYATSDIAALYVSSPNGSSGDERRHDGAPAVESREPSGCPPTSLGADGLIVRAGETLTFNTTGELQLSGDVNDRAGAAGAYGQRRPGPRAPTPSAFAGALDRTDQQRPALCDWQPDERRDAGERTAVPRHQRRFG